ncbi:hypothetical protein V6Z11_A04G175400 [Gossypium hirsutum]
MCATRLEPWPKGYRFRPLKSLLRFQFLAKEMWSPMAHTRRYGCVLACVREPCWRTETWRGCWRLQRVAAQMREG